MHNIHSKLDASFDLTRCHWRFFLLPEMGDAEKAKLDDNDSVFNSDLNTELRRMMEDVSIVIRPNRIQ